MRPPPWRGWAFIRSILQAGVFQRFINTMFAQSVRGGSADIDMILVCHSKSVSHDVSLLLALRGVVAPVIGEALPHQEIHTLIRTKLEQAGLKLTLLEDYSNDKKAVYAIQIPYPLLSKTAEDMNLQVQSKKGTMMPFTEEAATAGILKDFAPSREYFSSFLRQQACEAVLEADRTADGRALLPLLVHEGLLEYYPTHEPAALEALLTKFKQDPSSATDDIASYFGTSRAFYFAFTDMYTQTLFFPAIMGILVYLSQAGDYKELSWVLVEIINDAHAPHAHGLTCSL